MDNTARNEGIDSFRLLACFSVISLHIGYYRTLPDWAGVLIRLSGRWAVPFFFIVSGYFLATKTKPDRCVKSLIRAGSIFAIASVFLIPLVLVQTDLRHALMKIFSIEVITGGTYYHLWFLSALTFCLLFFLACDYWKLSRYFGAFTLISLTSSLVLGVYNPFEPYGLELGRYVSGIGFIIIGMHLRNSNLGIRFAICLVVLGFLLQIVEAYGIKHYLGKDPHSPQILIGTIPFAIGMFIIAKSLNFKGSAHLANLGRTHALPVYIFHVYVVWAITEIVLKMGYPPIIRDVLVVPLTFLITLNLSIAVEKFAPRLFNLMSGDLSIILPSKPKAKTTLASE
ncbi:acyltransferase [Pelagicoccus albus]|uniref:Acyltransferase family protein n=1 Tax=Pelagicoccus albus TaxID=415222 RepID=A0A7X1B851_9BACT|nr:acyltransferase family protein [Pelagicoccus albus]MBC2607422.1 acyltransferase family protein [Pelagicoccus albus]